LNLGDISSSLIILKDDRPKRFMYSVDSWLLEINLIELKDSTNVNSTRIEWTVYTRRRSVLFQVRFIGKKNKNYDLSSLVFTFTIC
jgi:hypothetical protein